VEEVQIGSLLPKCIIQDIRESLQNIKCCVVAIMSEPDRDALALWRLRSLDNSAVRSYYIYEYLRRLLRSQDKSVLDNISMPVGIAASVFSIIVFFQSPGSRNEVLLAYGIVIFILAAIPVLERKYWRKNTLDDITSLGIYLDLASKYEHELRMAINFDQTDPSIAEFIEDSKDALLGILPFVQTEIAKLKTRDEYPRCLAKLSRSEAWVKRLDERVKIYVKDGLLS